MLPLTLLGAPRAASAPLAPARGLLGLLTEGEVAMSELEHTVHIGTVVPLALGLVEEVRREKRNTDALSTEATIGDDGFSGVDGRGGSMICNTTSVITRARAIAASAQTVGDIAYSFHAVPQMPLRRRWGTADP